MNTLITRSALSIFLAMGLVGCANDDSGNPAETEAAAASTEYQHPLTVIADNVVIPTYANLKDSTDELLTSVQSYCTAIGGVNEATELAQARIRWSSVLNDVQTSLAFQIGPIAENDQAQSKRLNSPDSASSCVVDRSVCLLYTSPSPRDRG